MLAQQASLSLAVARMPPLLYVIIRCIARSSADYIQIHCGALCAD